MRTYGSNGSKLCCGVQTDPCS